MNKIRLDWNKQYVMILLKIEKLRRIKYKVEQRYRLATDEDI
jgi:hypothetical protein